MSIRNGLIIVIATTAIKCLLWPSYRSTDFDVHRNWKSVVQLPLHQWYFEDTCEWTLDYPPFFAYFEFVLSLFAQRLMPRTGMLQIEQVHVPTLDTVVFMRASVVCSDLVLIYAIYNFCSIRKYSVPATSLGAILLILNGGLLLIDHVHFQYNGVLMGVLILCCTCAYTGSYLSMAALFCILVLSKHLFAPFALVFAAYLIKHYCMSVPRSAGAPSHFSVRNFLRLVGIAVAALLLAFGPFIRDQYQKDMADLGDSYAQPPNFSVLVAAAKTQLVQMGSRLFPFGRGLLHAYPAANLWVLYYAADRAVLVLGRRLGLPLEAGSGPSFTSGLVTDISPSVFPKVTAMHCLSLVVAVLVPVLHQVATRPHRQISPHFFVKSLLFCSLSTFMLGYHVHEKAVLICLVLCSLLVCRTLRGADPDEDVADLAAGDAGVPSTALSASGSTGGASAAQELEQAAVAKWREAQAGKQASIALLMLRLCIVGVYALFPLFSSAPAMVLPKVFIYLCFVLFVWIFAYEQHAHRISKLQQWITFLFMASIFLHFVFAEVVHPYYFLAAGDTGAPPALLYPFLPLLTLSCIGAVQLLVCWVHSFIILMEDLP